MLANKLREKMGARSGAGEGGQQQGDSDDAMVLSDTTNTPNDDQPVRDAAAHNRVAVATTPLTLCLSVYLCCSVFVFVYVFVFVFAGGNVGESESMRARADATTHRNTRPAVETNKNPIRELESHSRTRVSLEYTFSITCKYQSLNVLKIAVFHYFPPNMQASSPEVKQVIDPKPAAAQAAGRAGFTKAGAEERYAAAFPDPAPRSNSTVATTSSSVDTPGVMGHPTHQEYVYPPPSPGCESTRSQPPQRKTYLFLSFFT